MCVRRAAATSSALAGDTKRSTSLSANLQAGRGENRRGRSPKEERGRSPKIGCESGRRACLCFVLTGGKQRARRERRLGESGAWVLRARHGGGLDAAERGRGAC
eukprot:scaffold12981_cov142-Isochrysis_galbana.AAC.3